MVDWESLLRGVRGIEAGWVLGSGCWVLVSGYWVLVSGYWFLVSGFWVLVGVDCFLIYYSLLKKG